MCVCETERDFFFSSRRRHTRLQGDWSSDVCSSDLKAAAVCILRFGVQLNGLKGLRRVWRQGSERSLTLAGAGAEARPLHLPGRSEEHTSELQSPCNLVCRLLLEKKKNNKKQ